MRKIDINIGQFIEGHAVFIEEAAKVEVETDRTHTANLKTIAGERIGGTATRDPFDTATPALLQNVPHDEEIFLVADIDDDRQFLFKLRFEPDVVVRIP